MMQVALCITQQHDLRLVFMALLVCLIGSAATVQLFGRILSASGPSRVGWIIADRGQHGDHGMVYAFRGNDGVPDAGACRA